MIDSMLLGGFPVPKNEIEQVILTLLKENKVRSAINLAMDINPSPEFAAAFAHGMISIDECSIDDFMEMKKISREKIFPNEADKILIQYIGPKGKKKDFIRSVPEEILQASSREMMEKLFEWALRDVIVEGFEHVNLFWLYLKEKHDR